MPVALPSILSLPPLTLTGRGSVVRLLAEAQGFGSRGLVVAGRSLLAAGLADRLGIGETDTAVRVVPHEGGEPTLDQLRRLIELARGHRPDWVLAVGGGSVLDVAKAAAGLCEAPLEPAAYHDGAPLPVSRLPFLAAPATAGTGSEATTVSVLTNARTGVKKSIRHASYMPRAVALDADLLASCPPAVLAASGMDAFVQAVESYLSRHATAVTQAWSLEAARLIAVNLVTACRRGTAGGVGEALLAGSYLAGLALSNARLGLVHGLAHPLGARCHVAHGVCCAVCLPAVLAFNRAGVSAADWERLGQAVGGDVGAVSDALLRDLAITSPFAGRPLADEPGIVAETLASGSTAANPRPVSAVDVSLVLRELFDAVGSELSVTRTDGHGLSRCRTPAGPWPPR